MVMKTWLFLLAVIANMDNNHKNAGPISQIKPANSLITKKTSKNAQGVTNKLKGTIAQMGLKVFSEVYHHDEAAKVGEELKYTYVTTFGNPKVGTKLMQCDQLIGYDLPLRILVTADKETTSITFRDPKTFSDTYDLKGCETIIEKISALMKEITNSAL
jgi:uncharacterized protein (DUF302 family)